MTPPALTASLADCVAQHWYRDFNDHRCPHDAWVEEVVIVEPSSGERSQVRRIDARIRLLGAYHDGFIEYHYSGVSRYGIQNRELLRGNRGHGDWFKDEFKKNADGSFLHVIQFDQAAWEFEAERIEYRWLPGTP